VTVKTVSHCNASAFCAVRGCSEAGEDFAASWFQLNNGDELRLFPFDTAFTVR